MTLNIRSKVLPVLTVFSGLLFNACSSSTNPQTPKSDSGADMGTLTGLGSDGSTKLDVGMPDVLLGNPTASDALISDVMANVDSPSYGANPDGVIVDVGTETRAEATDGGAGLDVTLGLGRDAKGVDATSSNGPAEAGDATGQGCSGGSLLANGSFEAPLVPSGGYTLFSNGQDISGWTVVGAAGNVAPVSTTFVQNGFAFEAQDGAQWLDLSGISNTATGVSQQVHTAAGVTYELSFWVGNVVNPGGIFGTSSTVIVLVNGLQIEAAQNSDGSGETEVNWKQFVVQFKADSDTTTIEFRNGDPSSDTNNGLDNVVLQACTGAGVGRTDGGAGNTGDGGKACVPVTAGNALAFDNTSQPQYVSIPDADALHLVSAITIEAWVSVLDTSFNCIVCKPFGTGSDDSFAVWFQGELFWGLNVPSTSGALSLGWPGGTTGTWHHIATTFEGSTGLQQIFIDGSLVASQTNHQGSPSYDGNPLLIGSDTDGGPTSFALGFKGSIDEVRIFSAVRTSQQIAADMAGGCSPVTDPTLIAYYPFNEGTGSVVHDASPNHLDGTLGAPDAGAGTSPRWTSSTVPF